MKQDDLVKYIKYPSLLKELSEEDLENLLLEYPYSQNIRFLLAQKSKIEKHPSFEKHLQLAATYMNSRTYLRQRLEANVKEELELAAAAVTETPNPITKPAIISKPTVESLPEVVFIPNEEINDEHLISLNNEKEAVITPSVVSDDTSPADSDNSIQAHSSDEEASIQKVDTSFEEEVFFDDEPAENYNDNLAAGEANRDNDEILHFSENQHHSDIRVDHRKDDNEEIDDLLNQPLIEVLDTSIVDKNSFIDEDIVEGESVEDIDILQEIDIIVEDHPNKAKPEANSDLNKINLPSTDLDEWIEQQEEDKQQKIDDIFEQKIESFVDVKDVAPLTPIVNPIKEAVIEEEKPTPELETEEEEEDDLNYDSEEIETDYEEEEEEEDIENQTENEKDKSKKKKKKKKNKDKAIIAFARRSIQENDEIVSETLAEILVKQGSIGKAIDMYERLSLIFPEKKAFFAERIQQLKNN